MNTLSRLINPLHAPASVQSVFHPAYARLHQEADRILGQPRALVFKGESGEIEIKPQADTRIAMLSGQHQDDWVLPRTLSQRFESVPCPDTEPLRALWHGAATDTYALNAILATTALALMTLTPELRLEAAQQRAPDANLRRKTATLCVTIVAESRRRMLAAGPLCAALSRGLRLTAHGFSPARRIQNVARGR